MNSYGNLIRSSVITKSNPSLKGFSGFKNRNTLFAPNGVQVRNLNIHEYQSKQLMEQYEVNCQKWKLATNVDEAKQGAQDLFKYQQQLKKSSGANGDKVPQEVVVKAQIHAGGRGKGVFDTGFKGGVHVCKSADEVANMTSKMLGHKLITKQTPPEGVPVNKVLLCGAVNFVSEKYFAVLMDRAAGGPVLVTSPKGGMDIEAVAEETPELIYKLPVKNIEQGPPEKDTEDLAKKLGFKDVKAASLQMRRLYKMFLKTDATQLEVNPFVETTDGQVLSVDAKMNFDDNASFRQKAVFDMHDPTEEDPREVKAAEFGLNYIRMHGNIGCMVNGAGLAMATMDIIKLYKGEPANFLDVGGGATTQQITEAFKIISSDTQVKTILVNIFGGIMRCDIIANGIVAALKQLKVDQPIVVRLAGTNVDLGKKILKESGYNIITADDLDDAAQKAVKATTTQKK